jgi:hypothetical protein
MILPSADPNGRPLLGAIVFDLEKCLPKTSDRTSTPEQTATISKVYREFDHRYRTRPDYKLWRSALIPHFATKKPWLKLPATKPWLIADVPTEWRDWAQFARSGAESEDQAVVWSTLSVVSDIMLQTAHDLARGGSAAPMWSFIERLYGRLRFKLHPLPLSPASSGISAITFLQRYQYLHHKAGHQTGIPVLVELMNDIKRWVAIVDPNWIPGSKFNMDRQRRERKGRNRLHPGRDIDEFTLLVNTLRNIWGSVADSIQELNQTTRWLQSEAYQFAGAAWMTARSRRLWEYKHQLENGWFDQKNSKIKRRDAFFSEFQCHLNFALAARDVEDYEQSAKLSYLLLRLIPDEFSKDPDVVKELRSRSPIYKVIREAGLEVDPRYETKGYYFNSPTAPWNQNQLVLPSETVLPPNSAGPSDSSPMEGPAKKSDSIHGFDLVLAGDQHRYPAWATVLQAFPKAEGASDSTYLQWVIKRLADYEDAASPAVLHAAYGLARKYFMVRSAGKILARAVYKRDFFISKMDVLDFVHSVRRCTTLDPFGMLHEKIAEWRTLILDACAQLYREASDRENWILPKHKLWIHETVVGRTHTHQRSLRYDSAALLYRKAAGTYQIDDLREFYDKQYDFMRRPLGVATPDTIARFCQKYQTSSLGSPVLVSLLPIGDFVSVLGIGANGVVYGAEIEGATDIDITKDRFIDEAEFWFRSSHLTFEQQLNWPKLFNTIGDTILKIVSQSDVNARVVLLSVDDSLAGLPWQHLITCRNRNAGSAQRSADIRSDLVVSIVPSLSAITIDGRDAAEFVAGARIVASAQRDDAIIRVSEAIESTMNTIGDTCVSACVVLGHGTLTQDAAITAVALGSDRHLATLEDWIDVLRSKHVILHCCSAGTTEPIFMRELGGIPGIALSLGAEVFLAPVTEVRWSVAVELQNSLFSNTSFAEIGLAYSTAITRNPSVSLYNLYGNPYASIFREQEHTGVANGTLAA